jgi:outer membrane receptor for Fe3+-dicitrate
LLKPQDKTDQDNKQPAETGNDDIVVIARKKQESSLSTTRSPDRVTRRRMLETAPRSVSEALSETPGVFVQKTNHGGGAPILRGLIGPQCSLPSTACGSITRAFRTGPPCRSQSFRPPRVRQH